VTFLLEAFLCIQNVNAEFDAGLSHPLQFSNALLLFGIFFGVRVFADPAETGKRVQFPRCRATVSEEIVLGHW